MKAVLSQKTRSEAPNDEEILEINAITNVPAYHSVSFVNVSHFHLPTVNCCNAETSPKAYQ